MKIEDIKTQGEVWTEYYDAFGYFSPDNVRPLCEPRRMVHGRGSDKAVILVHGLTDAPYAMMAVGDHFHRALGYDVYLPLLHCHGLQDPAGMEEVLLAEWKNNISFALETAGRSACRVAIGGLSTGGALAFHFAAVDPRVTGELYLFSGAFGLYGGPANMFSDLVEQLVMLPSVDRLSNSASLVGQNPYRYSRIPIVAVRQLVRLMRENDELIAGFLKQRAFGKRIFSAWTAADTVLNIKKIEQLAKIVPDDMYCSFVIDKKEKVKHAGVVLSRPVYPLGGGDGDSPLELPNPRFGEMMAVVSRFEKNEPCNQVQTSQV
ncbi:hypothetical protein SAMN05660330_02148 [Desulforhopalus singaporensis]|uniref:AB hydrolase-1 domain-containing protein n=1 Tax=Desulforhopalus singaporensis TaxID=91360 RepID=A0A1H0QZP8_9BACT|nr:alpha/beta fold hydrolase [Desulforhopalus singaporensis]SDP22734.1 hypothetical protein SAMN05660330_02148 [Desulforhopalus singaporensis]